MRDYLQIDTIPCDEECVSRLDFTNPDDYIKFSTIEANAFIEQIRREFETDLVSLILTWCPHDFGQYPQIYIL